MNAVIALCHFCEAHGPCVLFCTHILKHGQSPESVDKADNKCSACMSVGKKAALISKDDDGTVFCSRESLVNMEVSNLLRQAAVRSLSCEVSSKKEGGLVYFGDSVRGHVLSYSFQLKDAKARGLKRWFSVIVFMRDKMFLLNMLPFLSQNLQSTAVELQSLAEDIYNKDQEMCSERSLRLKSGKIESVSPRSLVQLTGDDQVFTNLHSTFTWILRTSPITYSETLYTSGDLISKLSADSNQNGSGIRRDAINNMSTADILAPRKIDDLTIRSLENVLGKDIFRGVLYCALCGKQIIVRSDSPNRINIANAIAAISPMKAEVIECMDYNNQKVDKVVICSKSVELPQPCAEICRLEQNYDSDRFELVWMGKLPLKCPTIMTQIEKAMKETILNDDLLYQHIKCLKLRWIGTAKALKCSLDTSPSKDAIFALNQALGISPSDELMINYWMNCVLTLD